MKLAILAFVLLHGFSSLHHAIGFCESSKLPLHFVTNMSRIRGFESVSLFARSPPRRGRGVPSEMRPRPQRKWNSLDYHNMINLTNTLIGMNVFMFLVTMIIFYY